MLCYILFSAYRILNYKRKHIAQIATHCLYLLRNYAGLAHAGNGIYFEEVDVVVIYYIIDPNNSAAIEPIVYF